MKTEELPAEMQKMSAEERKAHIEKNARERAELQTRINSLNREREQFVAQKMKETAGTDTLDAAMISAVRAQSAQRNFLFK